MKNDDKVEAIRARIDGEWDNPHLMKLGPLSTSMLEDIQRILDLKGPTYNHAYTIAFDVPGSSTEDGSDVTKEQLLAAIERRLDDLRRSSGEIYEAVGAPYDTFEEDA